MDKAKDFEKGWEEYKEKKKQEIEEMAYVIYKYGQTYDDCVEGAEYNLAKHLINAGYRKIPEGAVVVSKQIWDEHIENREEGMKTFEKRVRKETAEKFAERLKAEAYADDGVYYLTDSEIDEIAKEIMEGSNER